jgi:glycosyltransferase involved in cell wall biosynthesis
LSYSPKRLDPFPELARRSLEVSDACVLLGSSHTLYTYPENLRYKIDLVTVAASPLGAAVKSSEKYVPETKEFLWFSGAGAVHKGLDLVLDVFARNPDLVLNVVGNVLAEKDFLALYSKELRQTPNIRYHGFIKPESQRFRKIVERAFCFVAPYCSEGISAAVAACLQVGLYPIVSRDTGVVLPEGCGIYLEICSVEEIEVAARTAYEMTSERLTQEIAVTQAQALKAYSREMFRTEMRESLIRILRTHGSTTGWGKC